MNILKPIAFDVIHCVSQLFDYYLYAVYTFFGRNDMVQSFLIPLLLFDYILNILYWRAMGKTQTGQTYHACIVQYMSKSDSTQHFGRRKNIVAFASFGWKVQFSWTWPYPTSQQWCSVELECHGTSLLHGVEKKHVVSSSRQSIIRFIDWVWLLFEGRFAAKPCD